MNEDPHGRPHSWSAMSVPGTFSVVRAAAKSARRAGESAVHVIGRWTDPREKQIRRIRRARRRGAFLGSATGVATASTAGLAVASAPEWTMIATGGSAAVLAVPTAFAIASFRRLRSQPLPAGRLVKVILPPRTSAAFQSMGRLLGAQQSLHELIGILTRSEFLDAGEVAETADVASSAVRALTDMAVDIVAMERAAGSNARAGVHLGPTIANAAAELHIGVEQYEDLVSSAAKLTSPHGPRSSVVAVRKAELTEATDRLEGWAVALSELAVIRDRHPKISG